MKKALAWALVVLALAGAGYYFYSKKASSGMGGYVVEKVKKGDVTSYVSATGKLEPKVSVLVGSEVSGTIRDIHVENNSEVKRGQVLVRLDQELFQAQVDQAEANLKSAKAGLDELVASREVQRSEVSTGIDEKAAVLERSKSDYDRKAGLYEKGIISKEELDKAREDLSVNQARYDQALAGKARYEALDAQVEAAGARVKQAEASLKTARTNLSKTVIRAPMDGVVINKNVEVGQTVAASFSTPELLDIGDLSVMEVDTSIDEADVGQVEVGMTAEFNVDAFPDRIFTGTVSKIYYAPLVVQNVVSYSGIIDVENPDRLLRPGMTANVKIITNRKRGVLLLPNSALRVKISDKEKGKEPSEPPPGKRTVWLMKGSKPVPAFVKTGVTDFTNTEVLEGLAEGDDVIVDTLTAGEAGKNDGGGGGGYSTRRVMRMVH